MMLPPVSLVPAPVTRGEGLELIQADGVMTRMPDLKAGFCLVCRFDPGWGREQKQVVCNGPVHLQLLNERFMRGEILNLRWYQGPRVVYDVTMH